MNHVLRLSMAGLLLLASMPVTAAGPLRMADALARALTESPKLETYSYSIRAAEAERLQAGLLPNPELGLQLENFAGTGEISGVRGMETTLMLSQLLELGGKREKRELTAARNVGLIEADYDISRLDVLAEVARRFIHVARDQRLLKVAKEAVDLAESNRSSVAERVEAARAMQAELSRADIELARARLRLEHREHELLAAKRRLAASWGSDSVDFARVEADLFRLPATRDLDSLLSELRDSPDLARFLSERRLREAELELAKAGAVPDARIGAGIRRLESIDEQALMLNFSMELPVFDRNQGNIRAARKRLGQVAVDETTTYIEAQSLLFTTYQELRHARTEADTLREDVIPQSRRAMNSFEDGYAAGRFSYLEVADARREFMEVQAEAIRAAASYHSHLIEIERLTGLGFGVERGDLK
ncbi:cobalt-zinc-cadmium efflux system outer membrane protein [Methylohalomonas lacus]|uniref:Cobalt-zinc-cadmium efflux system outer membrane protein n=1 Tax=Methylohalomonas lacus TaxID=398773 RepID=A0AAE3HKM2_9GAMM|nr:TolC family protein [Methylohalomonas lacus]MCS3902881.1 cobalt-zinc-cadmium efflux system outer membrane protein [Methylohalomonas lacus]